MQAGKARIKKYKYSCVFGPKFKTIKNLFCAQAIKKIRASTHPVKNPKSSYTHQNEKNGEKIKRVVLLSPNYVPKYFSPNKVANR